MLVSGVPFGRATAALAGLQPVVGRMQRIGGGGKPLVVVDYAHTPDALEKTLVALKDINLTIASGAEIPIEERDPEEVTCFAGVPTAPPGARVYNPAFDITPAGNITAIITEKGVLERPNTNRIRGLFEEASTEAR
jgi:hypothetical protein